jgi:hypothetical protein
MKLSIALAILLILTHAKTSAVAQAPSPPDEEEGQICILVAYGWNGSPTETKQIKEIPVPKSYKAKKGSACGGYVDASYLIRWHLRYGNEDTIQQALSFIEKRDRTSDAISAQLGRDLTSALLDLENEFEVEGEKENSRLDLSQPDRLRSFLANTPAVNKLALVKNTLNFDLLNRIDLYLSAAEIFQSNLFATKARNIFTQYQAIETRLLPMRDSGRPDLDPYVSSALEVVQDSSSRDLTSMEIELRLAVLEAQLTPSTQTFDSARETLKRRHKPAYANAPKEAFSGGDDFCDLYEERHRNDWEREIAKACKADYAFVPKSMAYGYADAMLAILTESDQRGFGKWGWEDYVILHQKDMIYNSGQRNYMTGDNERVINLKLAVVDRHFAKSKAREGGRWSYEEAWRLLAELSSLINPAENPNRFRQIAERAIAVDAVMRNEDKGWQDKHAQLLAYYRLNLRNLDRLAIGDVS